VPVLWVGRAPVIAIGWFYVRNFMYSGSPLSGVGKVALPGRTYRSASDVLALPQLWTEFIEGWAGMRPWGVGSWPVNHTAAHAVVAVSIFSTLVWLVYRRRGRAFWLTAAMLLAFVLLLNVGQFYHAVGYGAFNWRYLMPGSFVLALLFLVSLLDWGRWTGTVWTALVTGGLAVGAVYDRALYISRVYREPWWGDASGFEVFPKIAADAGLPWWPVVAVLAASAVFWVVLVRSVWRSYARTADVVVAR